MTSLILPQDVIDELHERDRQEALRQAQLQASTYNSLGIRTIQHYDEETDTLVIQRQSDAEGVLDFAAQMRAAHPRNGYSEDRSIRHVGEIDAVVIEDWINKGLIEGLHDNVGIRRMLADRDYSGFRTVDKL